MADLEGANLNVVPERVSKGKSFDTSFTIRNNGNAPAGAFRVAFYASSNTYISEYDTPIGSAVISGITAGQNYSGTARLTIPDGYSASDIDQMFSVGMIIDADDAVTESDEFNNSNEGEGIDRDQVTLSSSTIAPPGRAVVTGPADGSDQTPTFTWNAASGADQYELWVSNRTTGRRVVHRTNLQSTSFTPSRSLLGGDHCVWVRAGNAAGWGKWSAPLDFEISTASSKPGKAVVTGPVTTSTARPIFTCEAVSGSERYELWVTNMTTGKRVIHSSSVVGTTFTPSTDMVAGNHRVWVRAWNNSGAGSWSSVHAFTLTGSTVNSSAPGATQVTGPSNTNDQTPTITWTAAANADRYELWVSNTTTGNRVVYRTNLTSTSFTPTTNMAAGQHSVWVRAWNGNVSGSWSVRHQFTLTASTSGSANARRDFSPTHNIKRTLTESMSSNEEHWYRLAVTSSRVLAMKLSALQADVDVELYSGPTTSTSLIASSSSSGTSNERILTDRLAAGTYYMRLVPRSTAATSYVLELNLTGRVSSSF